MTTTTPSFGHRSRPRGADLREAESYHEAGHAVVAALLGFGDIRLTVDPITELATEGRHHAPACNYEAPKDWSTETRVLRDVVVSYSGHMAEVIRGGPVLNGACQDSRDAQTMLAKLPERRRGAVSDQAITRARQALENNWGTVEWLASMLERHQLLGFELIDGYPVVHVAQDRPMPSERTAARRQRGTGSAK